MAQHTKLIIHGWKRPQLLAAVLLGALLLPSGLLAAPQDTAQQAAVAEAQDEAMLDRMRDELTDTVNSTAAWIDSLFADSVNPEDYQDGYGSLTLRPEWDQYDGFKIDSSFRARLVFPQAQQRFSAVIGRADFDDFINNTRTTRPSVIQRDQADEEWMVGLGFDPWLDTDHRVSFAAGFRGGISLDPYVSATYRHETVLSEVSELKSQSVGFWRDSDGFGIAQTFEHDRVLSEYWFNKFWIRGTFAERTAGVRWHLSNKTYYLYDTEKAVGTEFWWYGETRAAVPLQDYGVRLLHRQRFQRDWLYSESWVGFHKPRQQLSEPRRSSWLVGIELELLFGN